MFNYVHLWITGSGDERSRQAGTFNDGGEAKRGPDAARQLEAPVGS